MSPENKNPDRLLWKFDSILWGLLKKEAQRKKRSAPRQLEEILDERYRPDELSEEERNEALRLAATKDTKREKAEGIEPTPKKAAKKQANGSRKNR